MAFAPPFSFWGSVLHKSNCLAWWEFSSSGTPQTDSSGNGNTLALTSTVPVAGSSGGIIGNCLQFATKGSYNGYTGTSSSFTPSASQVTSVGWYKITNLTAGGVYSRFGGFGPSHTADSGSNAQLFLYVLNTGVLVLSWATSSSAFGTLTLGAPAISLNAWYMIAFGRNSVNGSVWAWISSTPSTIYSSSVTPFNTGTSCFQVGCVGGLGNYDWAPQGYVDEVSCWNIPLTIAQLQWLYNGGSGRQFAALPT